MTVWFSADFHLDHQNIIKYDGRPDRTVDDMNARIVNTINEYVKKNDLFVYLGDFCLPRIDRDDNEGYVDRVQYWLNQFSCKNWIYICGNHDRTYRLHHGEFLPNWWFWNLFQWRYQCGSCGNVWPYGSLSIRTCCATSSYPIYDIHPIGYELRLTKKICSEHHIPMDFEKSLIVCTHYSMRCWNRSHHNSLNLFAHSHGSLPGIKNSFDVGFNIWNRPLSLVEILTDLMPKHNTTEAGQVHFGHHERV